MISWCLILHAASRELMNIQDLSLVLILQVWSPKTPICAFLPVTLTNLDLYWHCKRFCFGALGTKLGGAIAANICRREGSVAASLCIFCLIIRKICARYKESHNLYNPSFRWRWRRISSSNKLFKGWTTTTAFNLFLKFCKISHQCYVRIFVLGMQNSVFWSGIVFLFASEIVSKR